MRIELRFLAVAGIVGLASETLLAPGIGLPLLVLIVAACAHLLRHSLERPATLGNLLIWAVPLGFGLEVTLYDSRVVAGYGQPLTLWSSLCAAYLTLRGPYQFDDFSDLCARTAGTALTSPGEWPAGLVPLRAVRSHQSGRLVKGLLGGAVLCAVFATLFCSADPIFASKLSSCLELAQLDQAARLLRALLIGLFCLGFVRRALFRTFGERSEACPESDWLTAAVALACVNALFTAFLSIQVRYLFLHEGDLASHGLAFATYARKGFFELAACTGLVFLLSYSFYQRHRGDRQPWVRWLCCALALQTLVVSASALRRMGLYCDAYGLSVLRLYAGLGILAMVLCLAVLCWAHLARPGLARLQAALVLTGTLTLLATGSLNLEAEIVRYNARVVSQEQDWGYLSGLSCDAVPALREVGQGNPERQALCQAAIRTILSRPQPCGWASWNLARAAAQSGR